MSQSRKPAALAFGAAVATGTLLAGSMFSMQAMAHGYMQDAAAPSAKTAEGKCGEGKCGEGKCGGGKAEGDDSGTQTWTKGGGASVGKANNSREHGSGMASGKRQHHTMADMDTDKDGRMSRVEFDAAHKGSEEKFGGHDGDGDGFITQAEMDAHHAAMKVSKESHGKATAEGKCGEGKCGGKP